MGGLDPPTRRGVSLHATMQYGTTAEFQGAVLDLDDGSASTAESLKC